MKLQSLLPCYCIFIFVATQLSQGKHTNNCPKLCHNCRNEDGKKTLCIQYCSSYQWCGLSRAHRRYVDCTSCKPTTDKKLNFYSKNLIMFTTSSPQLSKNNSQSPQSSNTFLIYIFPTIITIIVIIIIVIILVRKYTLIRNKLSSHNIDPLQEKIILQSMTDIT